LGKGVDKKFGRLEIGKKGNTKISGASSNLVIVVN